MPMSKEMTKASPPEQQEFNEKNYIKLEKEYVLFKEKTYENLQQYNKMFEMLEEETESKKELLQQLTSAQETISHLEQKIIQLENMNKVLNGLKNSKLGRLTIKYWALRKRFGKRAFKGVNKS